MITSCRVESNKYNPVWNTCMMARPLGASALVGALVVTSMWSHVAAWRGKNV